MPGPDRSRKHCPTAPVSDVPALLKFEHDLLRREEAIPHGVLFCVGFKSRALYPISSDKRHWTRVMNSLEKIIDDFEFLDDWDDRYRYVIELGKALPDLPEDKKTLANKVMGCASQVWLVSHISGDPLDPLMTFEGDSDAHIVRGLVAIVLAIYSGRQASEIANLDALDVFNKIGLVEHLSAQRANGLRSMIRRIREEARVRVAA
jgi:cysteine desulfuration protein SufE